jgi:hypothetical protein
VIAMSMVTCDHCDAYIDSDFDPDCFIENPYDSKDTTILCEPCRERAYDRYQESLMEGGGGPTLLEQQIAAMVLK